MYGKKCEKYSIPCTLSSVFTCDKRELFYILSLIDTFDSLLSENKQSINSDNSDFFYMYSFNISSH